LTNHAIAQQFLQLQDRRNLVLHHLPTGMPVQPEDDFTDNVRIDGRLESALPRLQR